MKEKEYRTIAANIKKYRKLQNITQEKMAFELDLDPQYYSQLEQGRRHFTLERIMDCCGILNLRIEDIVPSPKENEKGKKELIEKIVKKLASATCRQLLLIDRLIDDISPYV